MKIEHIDPAKLVPADYNPRRIDDHQLEALKRSISRWGFVQPVIVNDRTGLIVGGHQRVTAAMELALETVPVVRVTLDEAAEKALNIALNKVSGQWDASKLVGLLEDLKDDGWDLVDLGFNDEDLEDLLDSEPDLPSLQGDPDEVPEPPAEPITKPGDVWIMGHHRLICGDSTDPEVVAKVMGGDTAGVIWTDPPYGVNHVGGSKDPRRESYRSGGVVHNDDKTGGRLVSMVGTALRNITAEPACSVYVASPPGAPLVDMVAGMEAGGFVFRHSLAWVKSAFVFGRADYHYQHELILYGWAGSHKWQGPRNLSTVFDFRRGDKTIMHPTSKPLGLVADMIRNHPGDVADPFAGSGTTILAAEQEGRRCFAVELSPAYCDVIVARWEAATGRKAVLADA